MHDTGKNDGPRFTELAACKPLAKLKRTTSARTSRLFDQFTSLITFLTCLGPLDLASNTLGDERARAPGTGAALGCETARLRLSAATITSLTAATVYRVARRLALSELRTEGISQRPRAARSASLNISDGGRPSSGSKSSRRVTASPPTEHEDAERATTRAFAISSEIRDDPPRGPREGLHCFR